MGTADASPQETGLAGAAARLALGPLPEPGADGDGTYVAILRRTQAAQLRKALWLNVLGVLPLSLVFAGLWWGRGFDVQVTVWLGLGLGASAIASAMLAAQRGRSGDALGAGLLRGLLWGAVVATLLAGAMFGWGWLQLVERLPAPERTAYMLANLVVLLWGINAYSAALPLLLAFWVTGVLPGIYVVAGPDQPLTAWLGSSVGLTLLAAASLIFAVRSARAFQANIILQERVFKLLEEVTRTRDEAVSATQAKSRFLASVSHDLRQPMHAINLYLASMSGHYERVRQDPFDQPSAQGVATALKSLQESTLYLNSMFESLLDISRLNAGAVGVAKRYTTMTRMMARLELEGSKLAAARGLRFEIRLPRQFQLMEVHTDPTLLERLVRNILVNALRYTQSGGVRLSLVTRAKTVDFRVVDTGPGIDRDLRGKIFDEFFQVPGSQVRESEGGGRGIGLGLAISARLAEKLGTRIRLHSKVGHGSVFAIRQTMRIALRPGSELPPLPPRQTRQRVAQDLFVAVIDDDAEIRRSTRQMLESLGATVFTAESAEQAVEQLGRAGRPPQLLLCDYRLGHDNGLQAIARLREEFNAEIPAILVTGDTSGEHVKEFGASGLRVLYKPITGHELVSAIEAEMAEVRAPSR